MNRDIFHIAHSVRMSAEQSDLAEVMLYGEIVQDYGKWYKEEYPNDQSASDFDKAIKEVRNSGATRLLLRINSPGGVCTESIAMRSILANAGFEEITIRIEGLCASAATDIATLPGAHVQIAEGSEYMIHNPWTIAWGFASDLEHAAEHLRSIERTTRGFYAQKSGQSDEQIKEWCDNETWFSAEEAVEYGFCDELLKAEDRTELPAAASVSKRFMDTMKSLYQSVPDCVQVVTDGSNASPVAGETTVIKNEEDVPGMDIKELTKDQLLAENPALVETIRQEAIVAERERQQEIDELTLPGFEADAAQAKADGMSAMDFHKMIVQKTRQKGKDFLAQRKEELAPAKQVAAGAAEDTKDSDDEELKRTARMIADEAAKLNAANNGMY